MINQALIDHVSQLKQHGLHRRRMLANIADREIVNFSSSDYLSLTTEPLIRHALQKGFANYPTGSGGSMVVCGYHPIHRELEQAFAQALGVDDALLFSSGYAANLGVISLLSHFNAHLFIDKGAHASFYDGLKLTKASYSRYLHNDLNNLTDKLLSEKMLTREPRIRSSKTLSSYSRGKTRGERSLGTQNPVIIAESVFSMSGQATNLREIVALCANFGAECIVDEAHAFGVFGQQGLGAVQQYHLSQHEIPLRVIPLGKAFALQGGIVAGRSAWIDALLQLARSHIYSTAVSPALAYGILETLHFIRQADDRRQKLYDLIHYFQQKCKNSPLKWRASATPIQQLQLGCPHKALAYSHYLQSEGIFCQAMREPTVSKKDTGLRVVLNYCHEPEHIDSLFAKLHQASNRDFK